MKRIFNRFIREKFFNIVTRKLTIPTRLKDGQLLTIDFQKWYANFRKKQLPKYRKSHVNKFMVRKWIQS